MHPADGADSSNKNWRKQAAKTPQFYSVPVGAEAVYSLPSIGPGMTNLLNTGMAFVA